MGVHPGARPPRQRGLRRIEGHGRTVRPVKLKAPVADEMVWASVTRSPVPLVYLDLNHYIQLAKARLAEAGYVSGNGRPVVVLPGYANLLAAARRAKEEGRAQFPLSGTHFMEVAHRVPSPRQRSHVADIMEELSDFTYLLGRPWLVQMEIAAGLDKMYGTEPSYAPTTLLQGSALWAFGQQGGFRFIDKAGNDLGPQIRRDLGDAAYEAQLAMMNHMRERKLLEGPQDQEIDDLRALGYAPETYDTGIQSRLDFERQTSTILQNDPTWRRSRLRDLVSGREIAHEWMTPFVRHLKQREEDGFSHDLPDAADLVSFWAAMPQVQVAISMKTVYHRDSAREWRTNDVADIDALSVAYAYTDAILTDKQARAALAGSKELRTFGARLLRTADDAAEWIEHLPMVRDPDRRVFHPLQRETRG